MEAESKVRTYHTWTASGLDCHHSGSDCANCVIHRALGWHKEPFNSEKKCHQPDANRILLEKNIHPDECSPKESSPPLRKALPGDYTGREREQFAHHVRQKIVRLLEKWGEGSLKQITGHFNAVSLDQQWAGEPLQAQIYKMVRAGVLKVSEASSAREGTPVYQVADASKLPGLLRQNYRAGNPFGMNGRDAE